MKSNYISQHRKPCMRNPTICLIRRQLRPGVLRGWSCAAQRRGWEGRVKGLQATMETTWCHGERKKRGDKTEGCYHHSALCSPVPGYGRKSVGISPALMAACWILLGLRGFTALSIYSPQLPRLSWDPTIQTQENPFCKAPQSWNVGPQILQMVLSSS